MSRKRFIFPLRVQLAFYAFALTLPTAAIKTFSALSGIPVPAAFYIGGCILSVLIFWLFFTIIWSVLAWEAEGV